jgi:hypothetical protein
MRCLSLDGFENYLASLKAQLKDGSQRRGPVAFPEGVAKNTRTVAAGSINPNLP